MHRRLWATISRLSDELGEYDLSRADAGLLVPDYDESDQYEADELEQWRDDLRDALKRARERSE